MIGPWADYVERSDREDVEGGGFGDSVWRDFRYAFQGMDYRKGDHKIKRKWCSKNI